MKDYKCFWCGALVESPTKGQKDRLKVSGRIYCSKQCSSEYSKKISSETMSRTNKKYASDRMKQNNPMHDKTSKEKMVKTLKRMGHKPSIQGGNGKDIPNPQRILFNELKIIGLVCSLEEPINTGMGKSKGYPTCYKVDIAIPNKKIAIEVDGRSHNLLERKRLDLKKDNFLHGLGWSVIRFKNDQVLNNLKSVCDAITSLPR